jgi:hypothetical protein
MNVKKIAPGGRQPPGVFFLAVKPRDCAGALGLGGRLRRDRGLRGGRCFAVPVLLFGIT